MKIAICTIGSRGDIQPFLVLGKALAGKGHDVRFSTAELYRTMVERYQLNFVSFQGDYESLIDSEEMKKLIGKNPLTIKRNLRKHAFPIIESSLDTFLEVAKWADIVIYHPKTLIDSFGHLFPKKLIKAYVVPLFTPTKAFASPVLSNLTIPSFLNKTSFKITNALMSTVREPTENFRRKRGIKGKSHFLNTPILYGISEHFLKKPSDYPSNHHYTGFWFDKSSDEDIPSEVIKFFNTGKKRLIITFGSMPYKSKIAINDFIRVLQENTAVRILIVRGWGLKNQHIDENEDTMAIEGAPFDKLSPLADAVVHHGGAGTTAVTLKAGIPMLICPVLFPTGDQLFWGKIVHRQMLGVKPIPLEKMTINQFRVSATQLLQNGYSDSNLRLKKQIANEDGVQSAIELIEKYGSTQTLL